MPERTLESQQIYDGRIVKLRLDNVRLPNGHVTKREIVEHGGCVAIIAIDGNGNILLVKQYRKAVEKELLEIPAGIIEPHEDPVTTVRRELREETGYNPSVVDRVGYFYASPGYSSECVNLFIARKLKPGKLKADDTEGIEVLRYSPDDIRQMIKNGSIRDAKSIAGLLIYLSLIQPTEED